VDNSKIKHQGSRVQARLINLLHNLFGPLKTTTPKRAAAIDAFPEFCNRIKARLPRGSRA